MNDILIKNICLGGIASSDMLGNENSVTELVGFDIHSQPGVLKVNNCLQGFGASFSGEKIIGIKTSYGDALFFSQTTGKVWKENTVLSGNDLVYTTAPTSGAAGCLGVAEFNGYIYWATETKIFRVSLTTTTMSTWGTSPVELTDSLYTPGVGGDANHHPFCVLNNVLYIGCGKYLYAIDAAGNVNTNALNGNIKDPFRIKTLGVFRGNLLIGLYGGYFGDHLRYTNILEWNTWSESFNTLDDVPATSINAIIPLDNNILVNIGKKGMLYTYDGEYLNFFRQIPGDYSGTKTAEILPNAVFNFRGLPLFGVSNDSASIITAKTGVYSFGRSGADMPHVLNLENLIKDNDDRLEKDLLITSIFGNYASLYVCAYRPSATKDIVYKLTNTDKNSQAYYKTRIYDLTGGEDITAKKTILGYRSFPAYSSIKVEVSKNFGSFVEMTMINDTENKVLVSKDNVGRCNYLQSRITVSLSVSNSTNTPDLTFLRIIL